MGKENVRAGKYISFPTVADMLLANLSVGQRVRTEGYYTAGDGGHGEYIIVAPATGTDDNGLYNDLSTSPNNQAFLQLVNGEVNILQYGIKLNDISAASANTTRIQAALDNCYNVVVPAVNGLIYVTNSIALQNGRKLRGVTQFDREVFETDSDRGFKGDGLTGPTFITGSASQTTHAKVTFENIRVHNTVYPCIQLKKSASSKVVGCHLFTTESEALEVIDSDNVAVYGGEFYCTYASPAGTNYNITVDSNCATFSLQGNAIVDTGTNATGLNYASSLTDAWIERESIDPLWAYMTLSADQTSIADNLIHFDTKVGSSEITLSSYQFSLPKGKIYDIMVMAYFQFSTGQAVRYQIDRVTAPAGLTGKNAYAGTIGDTRAGVNCATMIVDLTGESTDVTYQIKITSAAGFSQIWAEATFLKIKELPLKVRP